MDREKRRGVYYSRGALVIGLLLVATTLTAQLALAQGGATSPEPAPTDAVQASGQRFKVTGRASIDQTTSGSKYAALLQAYSELLRHGLQNGFFAGSWAGERDGFRFYRVDSDHPAPEVISWLSRSRVVGDRSNKEERILTLESPELGSLAGTEPVMRATAMQDVDQDGLSDVVSVGYDGCIYIMKRPSQGESKIVARSHSFAVVELTTGPGFERMRLVIPQDLGDVELLSNGQARVFLEMEILEMVNGRLMGRTTENREVLISGNERLDRIRFSLSEPPDFAKLFDSTVEIRGTVISEKILENVDIRHNGVLTWESPEGIGIRALNFNLAREMVPGWNNFRITARDAEGFLELREVWVEAPGKAGRTRGRAKKKALFVTLDGKMRQQKYKQALAMRGFPASSVTFIEAKETSAQTVIDAVRAGEGAREFFLYLESDVNPGALIDGKELVFQDGRISASDLAQAFEAAGYEKVVGVFHTEINKALVKRSSADELWRDTSVFLERVSGAGRLMVANVEDRKHGSKKDRKVSRRRLLEALDRSSGDDLQRLLEFEKPQQTIFRGWMFGPSVL